MSDLREQEPNDKYLVSGLERGLRLLSEFSRQEKSLSAAELARRLAVPRSTVFRLLATLERMGFVEREEGSRNYRPGMAALRLGFEYLASQHITEIVKPLLERLRDEVGFSCNLVARDARAIVYIAKAAAPSALVSAVHVGARLPAHATVLGRVLLEDLSLEELRALYPEERLDVYSESTPRTVRELFDMVQQDRERGYVLQEGFFDARISTVAAPVRDRSRMIVAALGVTIPSPHIEIHRLDEITRRVRDAADELSRLLGYAAEKTERVLAPSP